MKLLFALSVVFLVGCGSQTPFKRGPVTLIDPGKTETPTPVELNEDYFDTNVLPKLNDDCMSCHNDIATNYDEAVALVEAGDLDESRLYQFATGLDSNHFSVWSEDSEEAKTLEAWIMGASE